MAERFVIRRAKAADVPTLARHRCEMFKDMGRLDPGSYQDLAAASEKYFAAAVPAGEYVAWLVVPEDEPERIVAGGGIQLRRNMPRPDQEGKLLKAGPQGLIVNIYTEPEWRRQGLAELVMQTMLDWSRENGVSGLVLNASPMGRPLYERLGFVEGTEMYYPYEILSGRKEPLHEPT
ncbi:MAG: GNAT family N-acetyltransferase [Chloroflexia bacterium]